MLRRMHDDDPESEYIAAAQQFESYEKIIAFRGDLEVVLADGWILTDPDILLIGNGYAKAYRLDPHQYPQIDGSSLRPGVTPDMPIHIEDGTYGSIFGFVYPRVVRPRTITPTE
ncbi:MAG: hypothetical protein KY429_08910 [Actinobacteria bacterium]|nr:hypothetical protein [Actinomycetota bacterium]